MLNLDTHILVFALNGVVTVRERNLLSAQRWGISGIVLWELYKLNELGRIEIDLAARETARVISRLHIWPIDLPVYNALNELDFRGDPADEIIAATSIAHNAPLLTRDKMIRGSKRVPLIK